MSTENILKFVWFESIARKISSKTIDFHWKLAKLKSIKWKKSLKMIKYAVECIKSNIFSLSLKKMTNCLWNAVFDVYLTCLLCYYWFFQSKIPYPMHKLINSIHFEHFIPISQFKWWNWKLAEEKYSHSKQSDHTWKEHNQNILSKQRYISSNWMEGKKSEELCEENKNKNWIERKRKKAKFFARQLQCDRKRQLYDVTLCMKHSVVSCMHTMGRQIHRMNYSFFPSILRFLQWISFFRFTSRYLLTVRNTIFFHFFRTFLHPNAIFLTMKKNLLSFLALTYVTGEFFFFKQNIDSNINTGWMYQHNHHSFIIWK